MYAYGSVCDENACEGFLKPWIDRGFHAVLKKQKPSGFCA